MANLYIASGFRDDCEKFIKLFNELQTIRYEHFASLWQKTNFSLIFCGRSCFSELREYVEEVLNMVKHYVTDRDRGITTRVCGLYMLYGLYFKQPTNCFYKIRMSYIDWQSFTSFINELKTGEHFDAVFIACKLQAARAFYHVITDRGYGLERSYRKYNDRIFDLAEREKFSMSETIKDSSKDEDYLKALENLNEMYYLAKCALPGGTGTAPEDSLNLVNKDISVVLETHYDELLAKELNENKEEMIGSKREKLRLKGFMTKAASKTSVLDNHNFSIANNVNSNCSKRGKRKVTKNLKELKSESADSDIINDKSPEIRKVVVSRILKKLGSKVDKGLNSNDLKRGKRKVNRSSKKVDSEGTDDDTVNDNILKKGKRKMTQNLTKIKSESADSDVNGKSPKKGKRAVKQNLKRLKSEDTDSDILNSSD